MFYPSLTPESRSYTTGIIATQRRDDLSGAVVRWLRGRSMVGHRLTLRYEQASSVEARLILDHYREAQGGFLTFSLPEAVWCGSTSYPGSDVEGGLSWRYQGAPTVTDAALSTFSLTVELIAVTTELPVQTVEPVASTTTTGLEVENDPAPPFEPYGIWFRAFSQLVSISSADVLLSVPVRQLFGEPIVEVQAPDVFHRVLYFPQAPSLVAVTSDLAALFYEQFNGRTREIALPSLGPQAQSEAIAESVVSSYEFTWRSDALQQLQVQLLPLLTSTDEISSTTPSTFAPSWKVLGSSVIAVPAATVQASEEISSVDTVYLTFQFRYLTGAATLLPIPTAVGDDDDYELDVIGVDASLVGSAPLAIEPFSLTVGSEYLPLSRASTEALIPFPTVAAGDADMPSRSSLLTSIPFPVTVGGDDDMPRRDSTALQAVVAVAVTANPLYVDFGSGSVNEGTAFSWGPSAGPTDISFSITASATVDTPSRASRELLAPFPVTLTGDPDMPRRQSQELPLLFPITVGSDDDMPRRDSSAVGFGFDLLATAANPAYVDFTSASPDEDAGFMEFGVTQALVVAFSITTGSIFSPTSRASTAATMQLNATAGGDADMPRRPGQALAYQLDATAAGDPDTPRRPSVALPFTLDLSATAAAPLYVDFTSGSADEDAGFQELGVTTALSIAFAITVGSLFSPFTRAGTPLDIAFSITVGGDDDMPRNTSTPLVTALDLTAGGDADTPRRAGATVDVAVLNPGLTQPTSFSDLTP